MLVEWVKGCENIYYLFRPLIETDINDALKLEMGDAEGLSPMNPINFKKIYANARQTTRFVIMVAENDSPAFHDQSIRFYEMLKATGVNAHFTEIKDTDHFGKCFKPYKYFKYNFYIFRCSGTLV